MKYSDLLRTADTGDLKLLLEAIAVFWRTVPKPERQGMGDLCELIDSTVAYRRRLDEVPEEQTSALRRSAEYILKEIAKVDPEKIIEEANVVRGGDHFEDGLYWLFKDGSYVKCDGHAEFVIDNQSVFLDRLGIDGWAMMRARHTGDGELMRLVLSSGAVAVQIFGGNKRRAKYQCCQKSLGWVKRKIEKMPIASSIVRVYDPAKEYPGFDGGIKFILHR